MKEEPIDVVTDDDIIEHNLRYLEDHPELKAQLLKRLKKPVKHTHPAQAKALVSEKKYTIYPWKH